MPIHILLAIKALLKDIMGSFADSFLKVITSITILFRKSLTLKPGTIRYQEKYWHIIHQMKSLKENWIISIKQLKCSIYYCNLRPKYFAIFSAPIFSLELLPFISLSLHLYHKKAPAIFKSETTGATIY